MFAVTAVIRRITINISGMVYENVGNWLYILIAIGGTTANLLCLNYFIHHERVSLSQRLTIMLNVTDTFYAAVGFGLFVAHRAYSVIHISQAIMESSPYGYAVILFLSFESGILTLILTITRIIVIKNPFVFVENRVVYALTAFFTICCTVQAILFLPALTKVKDAIKLELFSEIEVGFEVIISIFSSMIMIYYVWASSSPLETGMQINRNRKVTWTILTISIVFTATNGTGAIVSLLSRKFPEHVHEFQISVFLCFLLNSALNPVVYISRKKELRQSVLKLIRSMTFKTVTSTRRSLPNPSSSETNN